MRKFFVAAALAVVAMFGATTSAKAAFAARITTLATPGGVIITDGGAGDLDGGPNNTLTINFGDASYRLIGTISFNNSPGLANFAIMDVSYNISTLGLMGPGSNTTGGLATLEVSATDFTQPTGDVSVDNMINGNGNGTGTISVQQWVNTANTLFGTGPNTTGLQGPFNLPGGYGSTASLKFNIASPALYSITDKLTFNLTPGSSTSGDSQTIVSNPAPAGLLLALTGVPVFGIGAWFRRRRTSI